MRFSPPFPLTTLALAAALALLPGCGPASKSGSAPGAAIRPQSEFDYYCTLRPSRRGGDGKDAGPAGGGFVPTVYEAMRARGYKVYLVNYTWKRNADPFYPVSTGLPGGYGMRDFFGTPAATTISTQPAARSAQANANSGGAAGRAGYGLRNFFSLDDGSAPGPKTFGGRRAAVIWETRRGEFFLVDRYYASPIWLDGSSWLEKVRSYDPAAVAVEVWKS